MHLQYMLEYLYNLIGKYVNKATAVSTGNNTHKPLKIDFLSWWFFLFPKIAYSHMAMTIKQARKMLGKLADNISDEELEKEIKAAELLKTIFFQFIKTPTSSGVIPNENAKS